MRVPQSSGFCYITDSRLITLRANSTQKIVLLSRFDVSGLFHCEGDTWKRTKLGLRVLIARQAPNGAETFYPRDKPIKSRSLHIRVLDVLPVI